MTSFIKLHTPSQNGVAEWKNRHLLETTKALLFYMNVPKPFWVDAVSTCFLINCIPFSGCLVALALSGMFVRMSPN
jgi:hypothetical protein